MDQRTFFFYVSAHLSFQGFVIVHNVLPAAMGIESFDRMWVIFGLPRLDRVELEYEEINRFRIRFLETH